MSNNSAVEPGGVTIIVKICGITSVDMAQCAKDYGADFIGFVFASSRRRIDVKIAKKIAYQVSGIGKVGVFVNAPLAEVQEIAKSCRLDFVQLHGNENEEYCRQVGYPVIKAVKADIQINTDYLARFPAEWILIDTFFKGQFGGAGICFDWVGLQEIRARIAKPLLVAGGLTSNNVADAIKILNPTGVDVSGGVETNGQKDAAKISEFMQAVRRGRYNYSQQDT